jgi:hypothetical protein
MTATQIRVFRRQGDDLETVPERLWHAFVNGDAPFPGQSRAGAATGSGRLDILLITHRDGECVLAEPLSLRLDDHGYLQRMYVPADALPPQAGVPQSGVFDARLPFLKRYLRHAHHWSPTPAQVAKAVAASTRSGEPSTGSTR